jgi:hypothetical protein
MASPISSNQASQGSQSFNVDANSKSSESRTELITQQSNVESVRTQSLSQTSSSSQPRLFTLKRKRIGVGTGEPIQKEAKLKTGTTEVCPLTQSQTETPLSEWVEETSIKALPLEMIYAIFMKLDGVSLKKLQFVNSWTFNFVKDTPELHHSMFLELVIKKIFQTIDKISDINEKNQLLFEVFKKLEVTHPQQALAAAKLLSEDKNELKSHALCEIVSTLALTNID